GFISVSTPPSGHECHECHECHESAPGQPGLPRSPDGVYPCGAYPSFLCCCFLIVKHFTPVRPLAVLAQFTHSSRSLAPGVPSVVHNAERGDGPGSQQPPGLARPFSWEDPVVGSSEDDRVEERVIEIVCENLGVNKEQVTRSTSFTEDVGADSLDI